MADRQFKVAQSDTPTVGKFTPTVLLVDEDGNPVELGGGTADDLTIDDIEGLTAALAGKAASSHTHTAAQVNVAADATNGISADTLQAVLSALAARVVVLEEAAA